MQKGAGAESREHVGLPLTGSHIARQRQEAKREANRDYNEFLEKVVGWPLEVHFTQ